MNKPILINPVKYFVLKHPDKDEYVDFWHSGKFLIEPYLFRSEKSAKKAHYEYLKNKTIDSPANLKILEIQIQYNVTGERYSEVSKTVILNRFIKEVWDKENTDSYFSGKIPDKWDRRNFIEAVLRSNKAHQIYKIAYYGKGIDKEEYRKLGKSFQIGTYNKYHAFRNDDDYILQLLAVPNIETTFEVRDWVDKFKKFKVEFLR